MELLRENTGGRVGLARLCALFGHTRSAWYQKQERQLELAVEEELIVKKVLEIRAEQPRLGTRKLHALIEPFLLSHGIKKGRDALFDLLERQNLLVRRKKRKGPKTTDGTGAPLWPNLLESFDLSAPCQAWATDITYVPKEEAGWYYLMALTDLFSRKVVGWHLSGKQDVTACLAALKMAVEAHPGGVNGTVHHSDRGSQYRSADYLKCLTENNMMASMCLKPQENGVSERLNGILKNELLDGKALPADYEAAKELVARAVDTYNNRRPHDSLGGLTPAEVHAGRAPLPSLWLPKKRPVKEKQDSSLVQNQTFV